MLKAGVPALIYLFLLGYINAVPYFGENFDRDAEFVPLEQQHPHQLAQARSETPFPKEKPFEVDVVTSDVNDNSHGVFFQQFNPFFGHDVFNPFGGVGFGASQEHWWRGPNVCTEKEEDEKVVDEKENTGETEEIVPGVSESVNLRPSAFGQFHLSLNSCIEKPNKYVCTRILHKNGKKKILTVTRQCCHGYGRPRNAHFATPCDKIEIKTIEETATDIGAKEFVATAKSSGLLADTLTQRKNITVFMPIDAAFSAYMEQVQNENNVVEAKGDAALQSLYRRHICNGEWSMYDLLNDQILKTQDDSQTIRINAFDMPLELGSSHYTANCVPIVKYDTLAEQGMVHTVKGVLKPVKLTLMDMIRQRPDMSIMRTVLEKTKLSELLEDDNPVTIFVPTDDAFDKLEPHLRRALKEGKGCATNILKNHILDLTFCSVASVPRAKTTAFNLLGEPMRFNHSKAATEQSEVADLLGEQPIVINGMAKIIEADLMGTNGVMHVIDTILPTQSALPLSSLMQQKNVTIFKRLLEASGYDDKFDDMDNVTVFVPTDKAMQATKWPQLLTDEPEKLRNNDELIEFFNYHVVKPMIKTSDLSEQTMPTVAGPKVRVNLYSTHALFSNVMNRATVNCARLVHFDDESCGSVMHQVDKAMTPPKMNLLQLLESNPQYSKFLELVNRANLSRLLENAEESYTLLVPKNDVFEELPELENIIKDERALENIIKTHIVNDVVCCAGIIPTNWPFVRSIESLNGAHLRITRERRPKIENAGVTKCDNIAMNGIVHEINDIIVPNRRQQRPQQVFPQELDFADLFF